MGRAPRGRLGDLGARQPPFGSIISPPAAFTRRARRALGVFVATWWAPPQSVAAAFWLSNSAPGRSRTAALAHRGAEPSGRLLRVRLRRAVFARRLRARAVSSGHACRRRGGRLTQPAFWDEGASFRVAPPPVRTFAVSGLVPRSPPRPSGRGGILRRSLRLRRCPAGPVIWPPWSSSLFVRSCVARALGCG